MSDEQLLLKEIGRYLNGSYVAVVAHDFEHNRGSIYAASTHNQEYFDSYVHQYAHSNVWLSQESDYQPAGKIHVGEQIVPDHRLVKSEFYEGWLRPQNLHHRLCAILSREGPICVFLEVMRPRAWTRFDQDDVERCRSLLPHLQYVLRMRRRMARLEVERDAAFQILDQLPWGVSVVDGHGNRLATNQRAQEILLAGDGLTAQRSVPRPELADEAAQLDQLLSGALSRAPGQPPGGGALPITRPAKGRPLSVLVIPLRVNETEALDDGVRAAAIYLSDPDSPIGSNEQHLRDLYALTAVEARLAAQLAQGKSVGEAASAMGIAVNTARSYLKRIYNKTGVRRQAGLVRLLLLGFSLIDQNNYKNNRSRR